MLRKRFWILQAKRLSNEAYKQCVTCKRFKEQPQTQLMGQLPKERVSFERAFLHTGVDYAGPIQIKSSKLRNAKMQKGYIAIFICLGTKAIHMELVSDATQSAFLATFNRFIARRGLPTRMYLDNGKNFVGSWNKIQQEQKEFFHKQNEEIAALAATQGIDWQFIPPGAPTVGGLWERGVRSIKEHLRKQLKNTHLTFEEFNTVLCQIEATVNSRPLGPLTADCDNLNALTPGHFLIGEALLTQPSIPLADNVYNRTNRWRYIQLLHQHFWKRWHTEYLHQLQQRQKWRDRGTNLRRGDLVLIKEDNLPPRVWLMGRILETHPGHDGFVRVVTVKTKNGELKRHIGKIVPLVEASEKKMDSLDEKDSEKGMDSSDEEASEEKMDSLEQNSSSEEEAEDASEVQEPEIEKSSKDKEPTKRAKAAKPIPKTTRVLRPRLVNGLLITLGVILLLSSGLTTPVTNKKNELFTFTIF